MSSERTNSAAAARELLAHLRPLGLLIGLAACQTTPAPEPGPTPSAPARALTVERVAPFTPTVVQLTADSAMRASRAIRAATSVTVAPGLALDLWASDDMIADPIALSVDHLGRVFVTQTSRSSRSEIDIRAHQDWMIPSITFTSIDDKRAFYQRILAPEKSAQNDWWDDFNKDGSKDWRDMLVHKEAVIRIEDRDGDGLADYSQKVVEDFNQDIVNDVAHGVLADRNDLYLTVSPDIWRLRDTNGDGVMDTKESLAHGSGVHIGFGGHGLSGPIIGPDGRLYWKQGDLGVNITTREGRKLYNPHSGVIFRANRDGSEAEIFATGLRNPQEFAFDEWGNLIATDNDGDHPGETERIVYVADGMETGWRINWQFGKYIDPDNNPYKVWMAEELYKPRFAGQAAYITPPVSAWHAGPSGMVYNPGTALGESWKNYYFGAVFTGQAANARIAAFKLAPKGAGFSMTNDTTVLRGVLNTGLEFGPDGALYMSDWIQGWDPKGKGRVWKLDTPGAAATPVRAETRSLIAADFAGRSPADLAALLRHADMRVRQKAQFELVDRGASAELLAAARQTTHQLARVHGIWGVSQLARTDARQARPLVALLKDGDAEIRAQAAKALGDLRYGAAAGDLLPLLTDATPRARFFGAEALGRIRHRAAIQPIIAMLVANNDEDVYLRHAGVTALARIGDAGAIAALSTHSSRAVRLAAVVALRRMRSPEVARFLADRDELVVTEAARAINDDGGILPALPALAAVLDKQFAGEPLVRRAISANLRVGSAESARRLATYAARASASDATRAEAIAALGVWPKPSILDRVDGSHIGTVERDSAAARAALASIMEPLFANGSVAVQIALAEAVGKLRVAQASPLLLAKVRSGQTAELRIAALRGLALINDERTAEGVRIGLADQDASVRMSALSAIPPLNLPDATSTELLSSVIGKGSVAEKQAALSAMGRISGTTGREALTRLVEQLAKDSVAPEIQLDVAEAAKASNHAPLMARIAELDRTRAAGAPLAAYGDALRGGDARRGQRTAFTHPAAQCTRCHTVGGAAGANVGPPLSGVGSRLTREQLLEALVAPSARIAPGFGPVQLTLKNGDRVMGTLREETDTHIAVDAGGTAPRRVAKTDVAQRTNGPSAMPPMGGLLTRRELRDVVEYLSNLK
jgi:putative membrane-bound dehydrogenase-like protein